MGHRLLWSFFGAHICWRARKRWPAPIRRVHVRFETLQTNQSIMKCSFCARPESTEACSGPDPWLVRGRRAEDSLVMPSTEGQQDSPPSSPEGRGVTRRMQDRGLFCSYWARVDHSGMLFPPSLQGEQTTKSQPAKRGSCFAGDRLVLSPPAASLLVPPAGFGALDLRSCLAGLVLSPAGKEDDCLQVATIAFSFPSSPSLPPSPFRQFDIFTISPDRSRDTSSLILQTVLSCNGTGTWLFEASFIRQSQHSLRL